MTVNFSIPVHLYDYRESDNSLYSYAKLKIFYVGMTGDKRLFTKQFSDKLLKSLPYVPVVGFYDEKSDDFKGHHREVQNIYGIVPEDTGMEYIEEDGKEYAVCDVILYTGRRDKTGEIAQKIIGKQHSLELNPDNTTYTVNKDANGKVQSIEFKSGSLLGLSILGDGEKPAFAGSEFFTEQSQFMEMFEEFRKQLDAFAKTNGQRGGKMEDNTINQTSLEPEATKVEPEFVQNGEATPVVEPVVEPIAAEPQFNEGNTVSPETPEPALTREQKFVQEFMRVSEDERTKEIFSEFYKRFGDETWIVQWSSESKEIVFYDFKNSGYYRVMFEMAEEKVQNFGEAIQVRVRYLSDSEIDALWPKPSTGEFVGGEPEKTNGEGQQLGTVDNVGIHSNNGTNGDENEGFKQNIQEPKAVVKEDENQVSSAALNNSEREELEAFRREKKLNLIGSFSDDLSAEFLKTLQKEVDQHSYDELEISLSKEFTRISRQEKKITKPNTLVYTRDINPGKTTDADILADLVSKYKTKK